MSKQLSVAAAASIFALTALALFAPGSADIGSAAWSGTESSLPAPALSIKLPLVG